MQQSNEMQQSPGIDTSQQLPVRKSPCGEEQPAVQSDSLLHGIFEDMPNAVFLMSACGKIVRANAQARQLFGYSHRHVATLTVNDLLFSPEEESRQRLHETLSTLTTRCAIGNPARIHARRADGHVFPADIMASPLRSHGDHHVIITVRDITTECKCAEEARREDEQRFRGMIDHAPLGIATVSLDGQWDHINCAFCETLGYDRNELMGLSLQDIIHPEDLEVDAARKQQLLRAEISSYQIEKRCIRKDGCIMPALLTCSMLRDGKKGEVRLIVQLQDNSELKRAEEVVAALSSRLELATRAAGLAVWDYDLETGENVWDDRVYELYQVPKHIKGTYEVWHNIVHKDDVERIDAEAAEIYACRARSNVRPIEFRVVWPDGSIRNIVANSIVSYNDAGMPARITGISYDVTEARKKERALNAALAEKETLLKELYHRVKNNLQVITSLFNLQARSLPEGIARTALMEGAGRVRAMALVHEKLYQSRNLASISLDTYIADLCMQLGHAASAEQRGIVLEAQVHPLDIGVENAVPLGLLLNELISNSLQHAFPNRSHGRIVVRLETMENDMVRVSVNDNGIGFPAGTDLKSVHSMGLQLVTALSKQLNATLSLANQHGAYVSIEMPLTRKPEFTANHSKEGEQ